VEVIDYSDGEFQPSFEVNIRGRDVFIVQSTFPPAENLLELLMLVDAARRASAKRIVAVIPYFGFARQDRKDKPRVSIASKLIANLLTAAGVQRIITIDLHADQIQGFFDVPVDHVFASTIFVPYIKELGLKNLIMASPDTGGTRRAAAYAKFLNTGFVICYKQRSKPNEIDRIELVGDVTDKDVILIDDIIDTAGSITKAGNLIMDRGAKSVRAFCTHPVFSGDAYEKIQNSKFKEVIVTDTIPIKPGCDKIKVLSTADLFAEVISRALKTKSISSLYQIKDN
jgi:ribose-phosphate pyrophosphokinase